MILEDDHDFRYCQCADCRDLWFKHHQWRMWWEDYQYEKNGPRYV